MHLLHPMIGLKISWFGLVSCLGLMLFIRINELVVFTISLSEHWNSIFFPKKCSMPKTNDISQLNICFIFFEEMSSYSAWNIYISQKKKVIFGSLSGILWSFSFLIGNSVYYRRTKESSEISYFLVRGAHLGTYQN